MMKGQCIGLTMLSLLISGALSIQANAATVVSDTMISLSNHAGAVCNNGEPANMQVTLVADGAGVSNKWYVHLVGGGSCRDDASCQARWQGEAHNMRPLGSFPANGKLNLTRPAGAPFDGYNTVQIHYCSSDGWAGSKVGSVDGNGDPVVFNGTDTIVVDSAGSGEYAVHFRGKRILQAAFDELDTQYGVTTTATEVVVGGISAGSVGVQTHIDKIDALFGPATNVRGLMLDTWIPFLPLAGTETQVRSWLANQGISAPTVDSLLRFANFDIEDNLAAGYDTTANVWGAFNNISTEGWPGPAACFESLENEPEVIANPSLLMLCTLHDYVLNKAFNDGSTPFISTDMLVLRNMYDFAVGLVAFGLFPDHEEFTDEDFADVIQDILSLQPLSELRNYLDLETRNDVMVDSSSELARAMYMLLLPVLQVSLEGAAASPNVTVFAPFLEMTTENCSIFNLPGCSFLEENRRAIPTHGVVDAYASSTCAAGYALALGANPFNVTCVNTFNGHLIQPQGTTTLGKARTIKEYLKGWAALDSQYDYDLIGDVKLP
ncbi:pectin acetylesterase-family hydrolase [Woeseia oceani]|nr:pectin acetylesterase-family hydrolase [Woeseia oceani]